MRVQVLRAGRTPLGNKITILCFLSTRKQPTYALHWFPSCACWPIPPPCLNYSIITSRETLKSCSCLLPFLLLPRHQHSVHNSFPITHSTEQLHFAVFLGATPALAAYYYYCRCSAVAAVLYVPSTICIRKWLAGDEGGTAIISLCIASSCYRAAGKLRWGPRSGRCSFARRTIINIIKLIIVERQREVESGR